MSVFKVFSQDRVQERLLSLRNAVLSGLWSRLWILVCLVEFLQRLLRVLVNTLVKGFLALFTPEKKVRRWARTRVRGCPPVSAHPRRRLSWRVSSLMRTTMCGCGFLLVNGCCLARTRMSSAMSPVRACLWCSGWSRLCGHAATYSSSLRWTVDVAFFSSSTEWWILPLCSETGTHSVTLCFFGLVIDMPVVVHVKVVVFPSWCKCRFLWS